MRYKSKCLAKEVTEKEEIKLCEKWERQKINLTSIRHQILLLLRQATALNRFNKTQ